MVVAQSLPIPEVRGSNPVIGKIYIEHLFTCLLSPVLKRRKSREKRGREWPTLKKELITVNYSEALCYPRIAFLLIGQLKIRKLLQIQIRAKTVERSKRKFI